MVIEKLYVYCVDILKVIIAILIINRLGRMLFDGILIYTGQPWHPQLELIAGVLTSHKDGKPWVMRVRSQGEMDSLVHDAGFDKCTQRIDVWGIFTVSMAVRRDN